DDLAGHRDLGQGVHIGGDVVTIDQEQRSQVDGRAGLGDDLLDLDDVSDRHLVLLAARLDDGVHRRLLLGFARKRVRLTAGQLVRVRTGVGAGQTAPSPFTRWTRAGAGRRAGSRYDGGGAGPLPGRSRPPPRWNR